MKNFIAKYIEFCKAAIALCKKMHIVLFPLPFCPFSGGVYARTLVCVMFIRMSKRHTAEQWEHIILHEARHAWQVQHHPILFLKWIKVGMELSLPWHKRGTEVDAEAFANSDGEHGDMYALRHFPSN